MNTRKIEHRASGRAMTLGELAAFVQSAMRLDIPQDATIGGTLTWGSALRSVSVETSVEPDVPADLEKT